MNRTTPGRWERGESTPQPWQRKGLADVLGVDLDELDDLLRIDEVTTVTAPAAISAEWTPSVARRLVDTIHADSQAALMSADAPRLVHEWLVVDPPQSVALRAGRRIDAGLVDRVEHRIDHLRRLDDLIAGDDLARVIGRELHATTTLVHQGSYTDATGRRLLSALGDLCQLAGWAAADADRNRLAVHHYVTGIAAAHAAGDRALAGQLITTLAYHLANVGEARDAVLIAQSAVTGCQAGTTATVTALLLDRLAWAHARARDRRQVERTLGHVEEVYANRNPGDDPTWLYWLTQEEVDVMAGRCYVELSQPDRAIPLLERALRVYDEERPREAGLYLSYLAEAHHQQGDLEQAARLGCQVLELAGHTASTRAGDRARHLQHLLRPHRELPAVAGFVETYRAMMAGRATAPDRQAEGRTMCGTQLLDAEFTSR